MISEKDRLKLKTFIKELSAYKGRHTELVSVYIPQGYSLNKILEHLSQEQGTATNIKSSATRKNVISALEKMIQHLKLFKRTPKNGLAVFSGNVSPQEGRQDIKVWSIEPPTPLKVRIYRCDKEFVLEPLKDMLTEKHTYGLLIIDRKEADFGLLQGKSIIHLEHKKSAVPGKTRAGGQCLIPSTKVLTPNGYVRIDSLQIGDIVKGFNKRFCDAKIIDYWEVSKPETVIVKIGKHAIKSSIDHLFFVVKRKRLTQVPANQLREGWKLVQRSTNRNRLINITSVDTIPGVVKMVDISTTTNNFFANTVLVHNSAHRFERVREGLLKDFFKEVGNAAKAHFLDKDLKGLIIGGPGPTKHLFLEGDYLPTDLKNKIVAVKDIGYTNEFGLYELVDRSYDVMSEEAIIEEKKLLNRFLNLLAKNPKLTTYGLQEVKEKLLSGAVDTVIVNEDIADNVIKELSSICKNYNTKLFISSSKTREGIQIKNLGGVAAILRF